MTARSCEESLQRAYSDLFKKPYPSWRAASKQAQQSHKLFAAFTGLERRARFLLQVLGGADERAAEEGLRQQRRALAEKRGLAEAEVAAAAGAGVSEQQLIARLGDEVLAARPSAELLGAWRPCVPVALDLLRGREQVLRRRAALQGAGCGGRTSHDAAGGPRPHSRASAAAVAGARMTMDSTLHFACHDGHEATVRAARGAGGVARGAGRVQCSAAGPDAGCADGDTPAMLAAYKELVGCLRLLRAAGAELSLRCQVRG